MADADTVIETLSARLFSEYTERYYLSEKCRSYKRNELQKVLTFIPLKVIDPAALKMNCRVELILLIELCGDCIE